MRKSVIDRFQAKDIAQRAALLLVILACSGERYSDLGILMSKINADMLCLLEWLSLVVEEPAPSGGE